MHIASLMYSDMANKFLQMITLLASRSVVRWHGQQNRLLRQLDVVQEWER